MFSKTRFLNSFTIFYCACSNGSKSIHYVYFDAFLDPDNRNYNKIKISDLEDCLVLVAVRPLWVLSSHIVVYCPLPQITHIAPVRVCDGLHDALPVLQSSSLGSRNLPHCHVCQLRTGEQNKWLYLGTAEEHSCLLLLFMSQLKQISGFYIYITALLCVDVNTQ